MNYRESFQMPSQSFPTDVTSPAPTQLPGPNPEVTNGRTVPAPKPPEKEDEGFTRSEFLRLAQKASTTPSQKTEPTSRPRSNSRKSADSTGMNIRRDRSANISDSRSGKRRRSHA